LSQLSNNVYQRKSKFKTAMCNTNSLSAYSRFLLAGARILSGSLGGNSLSRKFSKKLFRKFSKKNQGTPFTITTKRGFKMSGVYGDSVDNQVGVYRDYETELSDYLSGLLKDSTSFLDVGCNIGWFSCLAGKAGKQGIKIISIDANVETLNQCKENLRLNAFDATTLLGAVGPNTGTAVFHIPCKRHSRASIGIQNASQFGDYTTVNVPMVTLRELLAHFPDGRCDLIKMDVEGYEPAILKNAGANLSDKVGRIVFEYSLQHLAGCGFDANTWKDYEWIADYRIMYLDASGSKIPVTDPVALPSDRGYTIILENKKWYPR
jgi:FkbM family methyltransferase